MPNLSALAAVIAGAALTLLHFWLMAAGLVGAGKELEETGKIRRLATVTVKNFPDPKLLNEKEFWRMISRDEPMLDSWGTPYRLERRESSGKDEFFWRSAGADRAFASADDLVVQVPFVEGPVTDFGTPGSETGAPVLDAR